MIPMEAAEKEAVEELKRRTLSDVTPKMLEDELLFYRFCKARDFNVSQAESMLRKHISWRKEFQIDTMLSQYKPPEVLVKYALSSFLCFTKDGALIRYVDCGGTDLKGLLRSSSKIELMKYFIHFVEDDAKRAIAHHNKPGFPLLMYAPIFDFRDFTYTNATSMKGLQWLVFVVKSYMDNYPEKLKYAMFINAPSYCTFLYSVIRQVLPSKVKQKIGFYGSDGWKQDLLEMVDANHLPAFLGGTKTDPDGNPLCKTFIQSCSTTHTAGSIRSRCTTMQE
ncbi:unnamed protein product [Larinioides sclopetarius]|uniref:CRAL-TRIO domain-containing protein n=1 Tax=Larinioides sclopetarius TaxID=280406 RepID=A0AAV2AS24_9ARAC